MKLITALRYSRLHVDCRYLVNEGLPRGTVWTLTKILNFFLPGLVLVLVEVDFFPPEKRKHMFYRPSLHESVTMQVYCYVGRKQSQGQKATRAPLIRTVSKVNLKRRWGSTHIGSPLGSRPQDSLRSMHSRLLITHPAHTAFLPNRKH